MNLQVQQAVGRRNRRGAFLEVDGRDYSLNKRDEHLAGVFIQGDSKKRRRRTVGDIGDCSYLLPLVNDGETLKFVVVVAVLCGVMLQWLGEELRAPQRLPCRAIWDLLELHQQTPLVRTEGLNGEVTLTPATSTTVQNRAYEETLLNLVGGGLNHYLALDAVGFHHMSDSVLHA